MGEAADELLPTSLKNLHSQIPTFLNSLSTWVASCIQDLQGPLEGGCGFLVIEDKKKKVLLDVTIKYLLP